MPSPCMAYHELAAPSLPPAPSTFQPLLSVCVLLFFLGTDWLMDPKGGGLENLADAVAKGNAMIAMGYLDHVCGAHGFEPKYYFCEASMRTYGGREGGREGGRKSGRAERTAWG